jgi:cell division protein FtsN
MVGPFNSRDEAVQFCESLKSAGGQCFVPRN